MSKTATLRLEDVRNDIAAALALCLSIDLEVVEGHSGCPFRTSGTSAKAVNGLARLLARFDPASADITQQERK